MNYGLVVFGDTRGASLKAVGQKSYYRSLRTANAAAQALIEAGAEQVRVYAREKVKDAKGVHQGTRGDFILHTSPPI